jgi:hypothetical protein
MNNIGRNEEGSDASLLDLYLQEYEKLKDEQIARIGFRDNLIYVSLGVFGGLISFSLTDSTHQYALLVIPWVSLVLGWTYLINDEKISSLGRYISTSLVSQIETDTKRGSVQVPTLFSWEHYHRQDIHRVRRKIQQLFVDQLTFVGPGVGALVTFLVAGPGLSLSLSIVIVVDIFFLVWIGAEICVYADIRRIKFTEYEKSHIDEADSEVPQK